MANDIMVINENELRRIAVKITNQSGVLLRLFNEMDSIVDDTSSCFQSSVGDSFRNKYADLKDDMKNTISNLASYKAELIKLINQSKSSQTNLSRKISNMTIDKGVERESIEYLG